VVLRQDSSVSHHFDMEALQMQLDSAAADAEAVQSQLNDEIQRLRSEHKSAVREAAALRDAVRQRDQKCADAEAAAANALDSLQHARGVMQSSEQRATAMATRIASLEEELAASRVQARLASRKSQSGSGAAPQSRDGSPLQAAHHRAASPSPPASTLALERRLAEALQECSSLREACSRFEARAADAETRAAAASTDTIQRLKAMEQELRQQVGLRLSWCDGGCA
jgi:chromosome segregation ATPase